MTIADELIQRVFTYPKERPRSLMRMESVDELQGQLHKNFATVHVAGTNGKGSVTHKIAKALELSGKKVGRFTSPHIRSFRERIAINSELILESAIEELLPPLFQKLADHYLEPSFFEVITALAFAYFAKEKVDIAVIETGIGGRLDATNVITPLVSVITSVGFDHTHMLGTSLEEIAREKGGIKKKGVPLVLGSTIKERELLSLPDVIRAEEKSGFYDFENRSTAKAALELLGVPQQAILEGILETPACRFEILNRGTEIVLDVAHNPTAMVRLIEALETFFPGRSYRFVVAFSQDKDKRSMLQTLSEKGEIHLVSTDHPRLAPADEPLRAGLAKALFLSTVKKEVLVICGTFFIMDEVRQFLKS